MRSLRRELVAGLLLVAALLLASRFLVSCNSNERPTMKNMNLQPGYADDVSRKSRVPGRRRGPPEPKGPEAPPIR
ncbi:MAG: hypothetical protein ACLQNE_09975 [Thermoguttaceae bacterium]